jgi:hypothetical protein
MNVSKLFNFRQNAPILDLDNANKFLKEARDCLNDTDGPEFVNGMRTAFWPLQECVTNETGKVVEYGDTLQEFARLTRDKPEPRLAALIELASKMKPAPAHGVRFVIAELILAYAFAGINPGGTLFKLMDLKAEALAILEVGAKYG